MKFFQFSTSSERSYFALAALLFGAMVLVNYGPIFAGKIPLPVQLVTQFPAWSEFHSRQTWQDVADIGDLIDYFYPYNAFSAQQIRQGTMPLWNGYVLGGMPFQAEPQTALFYPLHALYYVFQTPTAWTLALILRMLLGALFMTLLMRSVGATKMGAVISGMAFAFGGFMIAWQGAVMGDSVIWLPLVCYAVNSLHQEYSRRSVCLAGFAFAMPVLAGHPETAVHVMLIGVAAALVLWVFPSRSESRFSIRFLLVFFCAGGLALGLSAIQLLPTLDWVRQSGRDPNAVWDGAFPLHQALGFVTRDAVHAPNSAGIFVPNALGYVGMFTLLAAAFAPLFRGRRYVVWFAGLLLVGFAGTFGFEPVHWFLTHTPFIKGMKNERLVLLIDFGLAALAGLGVSALEEEQKARSLFRRVLPWLLLAVAFSLAMYGVHELRLATKIRVDAMRRPSFSRTLLLASLILLMWKLIRLRKSKFFPYVACALLIFDLSTFAYGYTTFAWRDEMYPSAPVFDFLKSKGPAESFRVASVGLTHTANTSIAYGFQSLMGFEAAVPPPLQRFVADIADVNADSIIVSAKKVLSSTDRRLDILNVKYLLVTSTQPEYVMFSQHPERFIEVFKRDVSAVFENVTALPRAFVIGAAGVRTVQGDVEQLDLLKQPTFDPLQTVVVESLPGELAGFVSEPDKDFSGSVMIVNSDVNGYQFRVQASTPGILVVSQNFFPGWKAMIDGRSAPVFRADHALTGIAVPEGSYDLHFRFQPPTFKIGAWVSLLSALVLAGLFLATSGRTFTIIARRPTQRR